MVSFARWIDVKISFHLSFFKRENIFRKKNTDPVGIRFLVFVWKIYVLKTDKNCFRGQCMSFIILNINVHVLKMISDVYCHKYYSYKVFNTDIPSPKKKKKKSGVTLTQLSLTLHDSRRIFYYQHYIHISSLFSMLCSWGIKWFYN